MYAPTACMHAVSGSISLPSQGFFSPFPHGTGSLSVSQEYLALADKVSRASPYSIHSLCPFVYRTITYYGCSSQSIPLKHNELNGLFRIRSPLLTESQLISFPKGTEMFHFPSFALHTYVFSV